MAYAVVVCLMYYNILYPTFYFMGLYTAGTTVMIGLVLALQFKVMFFHHQWAYPQVDAMLFSFFGMFLYYMLIAVAVDDYWNEAIMTYRESIMWLWSLLTVPLTAIFIDWLAYFIRFLWFPTREMLYREFEQQVSVCCASVFSALYIGNEIDVGNFDTYLCTLLLLTLLYRMCSTI